jgi:hypothetical protein
MIEDEKRELIEVIADALYVHPYEAAKAFAAIEPIIEKMIKRVILQEHSVSTLPPETAHWDEDEK